MPRLLQPPPLAEDKEEVGARPEVEAVVERLLERLLEDAAVVVLEDRTRRW